MDAKDAIPITISLAALLIAGWTYLSTRHGAVQAERAADTAERASKYALLNAKADLFVALRATFLSVHNSFPRERIDDFAPHRLAYRAYWINAYNEWYVTTKICPAYNLWEEFYQEAITSAATDPHIGLALHEMLDEGFAFGAKALRGEFLAAISIQHG
jgi:hypothetical protein